MARSGISSLDFFRKLPEELQEHSLTGSFFSLISFIFMAILITSHYSAYSYLGTENSITLDSHNEDRLRINLNVSLPAIPCTQASLDVSNYMGLQQLNLTRHLRRFRLSSDVNDLSNLQRVDEVVVEEQDEGIPLWGGAKRNAHAGVHYSQPLTEKNFQEFMSKYELVLINYYAPWCPFCQRLNPEWERAAAQLQDHPEFSERVMMASVDCTDRNAVPLCRRAGIRAFPSMLIYMFGSQSTHFVYNGPRSAEHLLQFLDLFYRRLEPDADHAEEVHTNGDTLGLPVHVNAETLKSIDIKAAKSKGKGVAAQLMAPGKVEGCEISGSISVNRVPGKVSLTARAPDHSLDLTVIDATHIVNHFSFGQIKRSEHLIDGKRQLITTDRYPLDGKSFLSKEDNVTIEHYLNVVPFDHEERRTSRFEPVKRVYEFSATSNQYESTEHMPAAVFSFDISPLVIKVRPEYIPWYHFVTHLCAVIGGVFTVIGLLDSGVFHTLKSIKKKQELGKQS